MFLFIIIWCTETQNWTPFIFIQMSCQLWDSGNLSQKGYQTKLPKTLPNFVFKFAAKKGQGYALSPSEVWHKTQTQVKKAHCEACRTEKWQAARLCLHCLVNKPHLCAQNANSTTSNLFFPHFPYKDTLKLKLSQCGKTSITRNVKCHTYGFIYVTFLFIWLTYKHLPK